MDKNDLSALEMNFWLVSHSSAQASHLNLALTKVLAQINSRIIFWRDWGSVFEAQRGVFFVLGQQPMKEGLT
jgi:hypothetical protein